MRIQFFTHYFPPEGNAPASRTYDNCKRWAAAGSIVDIITGVPNVPDGKVYPGYKNRFYQQEQMDGLHVHRVWTYVAPNKGAVRRTLNYLSYGFSAFFRGLRLSKPDLVLCTSPQFFCGICGVLVAKFRKVPVVLEIRDIWPESIETVGAMKKGKGIRLLEKMEQWMYRNADHLVTVGPGYKRKLCERGVPEQKIEVIPNGADLDFYSPGPPSPDLQARYGLDHNFTVAYVGTIGMACGLEVVIEAARILNSKERQGIRFLLVGDGARREELEAMAKAEHLDQLHFTGRLLKSEIPALLCSVDCCLIHLKKSELFKTVLPSKMFEAFAVGKPVLLGVDGDARAVLEAAKGGIYFEPGNAQKLVESILAVKDDQEALSRYGRSGRGFVEEHYSRDTLAGQYLTLLERLFIDFPAVSN